MTASLSPAATSPAAAFTPPSAVSCAHCGLPVGGAGPGSPAADERFCCSACELAYGIIHGAGLDAYYTQRNGSESRPSSARSTGRAYSEYDDPAFASRYVTSDATGSRLELFLEGIHCSACVWLVERLPRVVPGVRSSSLNLGHNAVEVVFDASLVRPSAIARALDGLGYPPHPSAASQRDGERRQERALWVRLGVGGALAGNVMLMALALYSGAAGDATFAALFRWGSLLLTAPAVFYCGSVFLRGGYAALRTRTPHMDLPISIGILAGFARSASNTFTGSGEVYFDSIAVLIFLLLVGRWLQQRHHQKARGALELIQALAPATARLVEGETRREVPAEAITAGAVVEVRAGERLPSDGVVLEGSSSIDSSWLTGESLPEDVKPGDRVYAGTQNCAAALVVRVEAAGQGTRLGRLLEAVERAQSRRAPIVRAPLPSRTRLASREASRTPRSRRTRRGPRRVPAHRRRAFLRFPRGEPRGPRERRPPRPGRWGAPTRFPPRSRAGRRRGRRRTRRARGDPRSTCRSCRTRWCPERRALRETHRP